MPEYTYTFYNLRTQNKLGSLPLYGVNCSDQLATAKGNTAGMFTGSIRLDSDFTSVQEILDMTDPRNTAVWMDRDGTPIWGGIVWTRTYQSDGRSMQFNAQTFQSYLNKVVWSPVAAVETYDLIENPHNIIRYLWVYLYNQASPEYDVGVRFETYHQVGDPVTNPDLFTTLPFIRKERKFLNEYCDQMLKLGAEYRIRLTVDEDGIRVPIIESGFADSIGVPAMVADTGPSFEYPGEVSKYWLTNSASNAPTRLFGVGKAEGDDDLSYIAQGSVTNRIGIDAVVSYESTDLTVVTNSTMNDLADMQEQLNRPVYEVASGNVNMDWALGDYRRVVIDDPNRYPSPMGGIVRLVGWTLSPAASDSVEQLSVSIDNPSNLVALNV